MKEKEPLKRSKKSSASGSWWGPLFIFFILAVVIFFIYLYFSSPDLETFKMRKNDNGQIEISGLEEREIEKMDWQRGVTYTNHFSGTKNKQYRLQGEGKNFFKRLIGKPTFYDTVAQLEENEIKGKEIEFPEFPSKNGKIIPKTQLIIGTKWNMFVEKGGWGIMDILQILVWILSIIASLWVIDMIFGTNIIGTISYPFRRKSRKGVSIPGVGFKDVGGLQEAKEELGEVVSYFRNPQLFWQRGAKLPKGILLVGPPGNGKTLLAKALAGECRMPFLFRSGSEFEEMVVGMGARRMRELFWQARSYPQGCIIFIDEIDSIGRKRYSANTGHAEQTLNQLLNELDGFHPRDNIIILAATNSLSVLDSALLRPGRFDRQILILPPNLKGRREIIRLCARKLSLKADVDLEEIATLTKGLSGAQIANIFNEASILSIRRGEKSIDYEMIFEAHDRTLMGPSLVSQTLTPTKRRIVAYHEAGHAVVGMSLPETTVKKITIIPRWSAGGYTWVDYYGERDDDYLLNKSQMLAQAMSSLGGRASEELVLGLEYVTIGASSDFKQATAIIRDLILRYGMSDLGIVPTQETFFSSEGISPELPEVAKQKIEQEREKIMQQCWKKVKDILRKKRRVLDLLAEVLLAKNSLQKEEINYIFVNQISPYIPLLN